MIVRNFTLVDQPELERIHRQYAYEFQLDDLNGEKYVITRDSGEIVTVGVNKSLAEVRLVTDKLADTKTKRTALINSLEISAFVAKRAGYDQLHAFVQDPVFLKQLIKHGFRPTKGISVVFDI